MGTDRNLTGAAGDMPGEERSGTETGIVDTRFRLLLESVPHIAFVIAVGGRAEYYNRRFLDYIGGPPGADTEARTALQHPDDQPALAAARAQARQDGQEYVVEARVRRHDGAYRWHRIHNIPLKLDGRLAGWLGTAVDIDDVRRANEVLEERVAARTAELAAANLALRREIAEREQAEAVLRESEARYHRLYDGTPMALHSVDATLHLIDVNDHWLALFGLAREEAVGRMLADFMTPDSAELYLTRSWQAVQASAGAVVTAEFRFLRRSGEAFDARVASRGEFDAAGRFMRSWTAIADITDQKRAEEQLRQTQRLEAIGQLTGGVAHDFNNLLTAIMGNLELLRARLPDDAARRRVDTAFAAAQRGGELTRQLLAYARKQRLEPRPVDVNATVAGMQDLLRRSLGGLVEIDLDASPDLWPALSDSAQIEAIVLNLAINARDAMPQGGRVSIATRNVDPAEGNLPAELAAGAYVLIAVADAGTGMAPDVAARAFEPFFTTKEVGKGSGLGLAQVQGTARQFGGAVRLRTAPGAGTTVEVFLPRAEAARSGQDAAGAEQGAAPAASPDRGGQGPRDAADPGSGREHAGVVVLVVDDEEDVRAVAVATLEEAGYAVREAGSGAAALASLEEAGPVALALVDHAMPGMSGTAFVRAARQRWPGLPVLYLTGHADPLSAEGAAPEDPVLMKPYRRDNLLAAIGHALAVR